VWLAHQMNGREEKIHRDQTQVILPRGGLETSPLSRVGNATTRISRVLSFLPVAILLEIVGGLSNKIGGENSDRGSDFHGDVTVVQVLRRCRACMPVRLGASHKTFFPTDRPAVNCPVVSTSREAPSMSDWSLASGILSSRSRRASCF
jgi:hypothetical protein